MSAPDDVSTHRLWEGRSVGCRHGCGPTNVLQDDQADVSVICLENGRGTVQPDSVEFDGLGQ